METGWEGQADRVQALSEAGDGNIIDQHVFGCLLKWRQVIRGWDCARN